MSKKGTRHGPSLGTGRARFRGQVGAGLGAGRARFRGQIGLGLRVGRAMFRDRSCQV